MDYEQFLNKFQNCGKDAEIFTHGVGGIVIRTPDGSFYTIKDIWYDGLLINIEVED